MPNAPAESYPLPPGRERNMDPGVEFKGRVESISPASAAAFSMLPPENKTGNWVKVTQRIPVRIALPPRDPRHPYRVGASCDVEINTTVEKPPAHVEP